MYVTELIERLQEMPEDAKVLVFDADMQEFYEAKNADYRLAAGGNNAEEWTTFVSDHLSNIMNSVFIHGEEIEDVELFIDE